MSVYTRIHPQQKVLVEALNISKLKALWRIWLPQVIQNSLGYLDNVFNVLIKTTPIVALVGLEDAFRTAWSIGRSYHQVFIWVIIVSLFYLVICLALHRFIVHLQRRTDYLGSLDFRLS